MGATFSNTSFLGPTQSQVIRVLEGHFPESKCFVSPSLQTWVTVYDAFSEWYGEPKIIDVASRVCLFCGCPAIAFDVADSDHLSYWLFNRSGSLVDKAISKHDPPTKTESSGLSGHLEQMVAVLNLKMGPDDLRDVLEKKEIYREDNLKALGALLEISNVDWGYNYLLQDCNEIDGRIVVGWKDFVFLEGPDPRT